jgi:hypothetical protein
MRITGIDSTAAHSCIAVVLVEMSVAVSCYAMRRQLEREKSEHNRYAVLYKEKTEELRVAKRTMGSLRDAQSAALADRDLRVMELGATVKELTRAKDAAESELRARSVHHSNLLSEVAQLQKRGVGLRDANASLTSKLQTQGEELLREAKLRTRHEAELQSMAERLTRVKDQAGSDGRSAGNEREQLQRELALANGEVTRLSDQLRKEKKASGTLLLAKKAAESEGSKMLQKAQVRRSRWLCVMWSVCTCPPHLVDCGRRLMERLAACEMRLLAHSLSSPHYHRRHRTHHLHRATLFRSTESVSSRPRSSWARCSSGCGRRGRCAAAPRNRCTSARWRAMRCRKRCVKLVHTVPSGSLTSGCLLPVPPPPPVLRGVHMQLDGLGKAKRGQELELSKKKTALKAALAELAVYKEQRVSQLQNRGDKQHPQQPRSARAALSMPHPPKDPLLESGPFSLATPNLDKAYRGRRAGQPKVCATALLGVHRASHITHVLACPL